jgi:hypothetical protein
MKLICWTPVIYDKKGFKKEGDKPFLPSDTIKEAITSAIIFYYIKKDKEIENKIKKYLLKNGLNLKEISKDIKNIVLNKYSILDNLEIPDKIYLPKDDIKKEYIEIFDIREKKEIKRFQTEVFKGIIEIDINSPHIEKIKAAAHSYAEALAKIEHSFLKDHPLDKKFYEPLLNEIKSWEIPLRIGMWTEVTFKGDLLFFWRIKEIREKLLKELNIDILPRYIIYAPREKQTTGWIELKTNEE